MRYVVAYEIPPYVGQVLKDGYSRVTGREMPANNLHISLIYPFHIYPTHSEEWVVNRLNNFHFESIDSRLTKIDVFEQNKKLLYVKVEPYEDYYASHLIVNRILRSGIQIDTKPFKSGTLPAYMPHIVVDYDFDGDELTLHSLSLEKIGAWFDSGYPRLYKFDENTFTEVMM
jgi:2'-5' RNA ligase